MPLPAQPPALQVSGYGLDYETPSGRFAALRDIDLSIARSEVLGLVGESGSGKTSLAFAILRDLGANARETGGSIRLAGEELTAKSTRELEAIRGRRIAMVFQDPGTSLNPTLPLGEQLAEVLRRHQGLSRRQAWREAEAALARVALKTPAEMMRRYPHEVSGGEKQRVAIATAFACQPDCILFDEPTTALDIITARQILELFERLQEETGVASLYISHDLALVSRIADRVAVIHRGRIVEEEPAAQVFSAPREDYTRQLIASVPRPDRRLVAPAPAAAAPLLEVEALTVRYGRDRLLDRLRGRASRQVEGNRAISLAVRPGEIFGIVGESGSGKSTLARALAGLNPFEGSFSFEGRRFARPAELDRAYRRAVQIVFQHPDSSLNPRQQIREILARPLRLYDAPGAASLAERVEALLAEVQLPADFARKYPHQLSGGEKQRVAIARAFASRPQLVICDEITSALDVSIQAQIVQLLLSLRERFGTTYLFITHDLNLIRQIAHRIAVMYRGDLVELVEVEALAAAGPRHAYTRALLEAVPTPVG
ncbi:peptide/nickel transport system ATP-binding protein [Tistlia consotensis]|uniref:Peptide/nickel transport system ATP-binding protein n=1 Tax=Tistlia consotensis USBA 355 TaxID=560819 RepID=A0A1Y6BDS8_9PROT|nr:ABC transporter ATP-binding protein [Tistlia consotensis]SME98321.1 peptide/nickel transport system ATP-binding protein [Tistlia consotensis USBA 355]SNR57631.1 peptide/nickel transport system ATP-binding protein [Tistlia consotensis]